MPRLKRTARWLVVLGLMSGSIAAVVGGLYIGLATRELQTMGVSPELLARFHREELSRWLGVVAAAIAVTFVTVLVLAFRSWRSPAIRFVKGVILAIVFLLSTSPANSPEQRKLLASGWIVHPPRVAIFLPGLIGLLSVVIYSAANRSKCPGAVGV
jgi:hypothetical protein